MDVMCTICITSFPESVWSSSVESHFVIHNSGKYTWLYDCDMYSNIKECVVMCTKRSFESSPSRQSQPENGDHIHADKGMTGHFGIQSLDARSVVTYFYVLLHIRVPEHTLAFKLDFVAEGDAGALDNYRLSLAINLYLHSKKEL